MTRFYDIDDANAALPELDGILATLAAQRAELVRLRDEVLARRPARAATSRAGDGAGADRRRRDRRSPPTSCA